MVKWLVGVAAVVALFFLAVPTAKVQTYVVVDPEPHVQNIGPASSDGYQPVVIGPLTRSKSGLRIAIEGRLRWLGII